MRQVVLASTDKVYGDVDRLPYIEEMPFLAQYPHDVSKACAEMIALGYATTYKLPVAITRLPNVYGGGKLNWSRIIPGTVRAALYGQAPEITSDGKFIHDYLYVEDAAAIHLLIAEQLAQHPNLRGQAFNVSNGTRLTVLELVSRILHLVGAELQPVVLNRAQHEIKNQYLDATKARQMLGWQPLFSMDQGLKLTVNWYRHFRGRGWSQMRVLIAGASGFLGAHVARLLVKEGCEVFALVRRGSDLWRIKDVQDSLQLVYGDVLDGEQMTTIIAEVRPECCLHLAWYAEPGVYLNSPLNVQYIGASLHLSHKAG